MFPCFPHLGEETGIVKTLHIAADRSTRTNTPVVMNESRRSGPLFWPWGLLDSYPGVFAEGAARPSVITSILGVCAQGGNRRPQKYRHKVRSNSQGRGGARCVSFRSTTILGASDFPMWPVRHLPEPFLAACAWNYHHSNVSRIFDKCLSKINVAGACSWVRMLMQDCFC